MDFIGVIENRACRERNMYEKKTYEYRWNLQENFANPKLYACTVRSADHFHWTVSSSLTDIRTHLTKQTFSKHVVGAKCNRQCISTINCMATWKSGLI